MELIIAAAIGAFCGVCSFLIGVKIGQKLSKGESIEIPSVNPLEAHRKREAKKEAEAEQERIAVIMGNIERYDGTGNNQEDVGR